MSDILGVLSDIGNAIGRATAAAATMGMSEVGLAAIDSSAQTQAAQQQAAQAANAAQRAAQGAAQAGRAGGDVNVNACCHFQIVGDYLLDAEKGKVWVFDKAKNQFLYVQRETPPAERDYMGIMLALQKEDLLKSLNMRFWNAPDAAKPQLRKAIDNFSKSIDVEIKRLVP